MDTHTTLTVGLADEAATLAFGEALASRLVPGMTVFLEGDLGAGKTTLTRGILRGFGHAGRVKSPTYALVESYELPQLAVHHFDLYRFADPEEWVDAGFRDLFDAGSLALIEWPEKALALLPAPDLTLTLRPDGPGRQATLTAHTERGLPCLNPY
ncbi:tRNA (adenosine(37)-N6)-threonylcarbamoyltransferase complex ATPase subunit type 1 TsaE [Laribacter hongkongensis]|uniref:tRNA threonylcarbamoyladenosine biosynthesis protein TsaE n=2 Tax=Laribacter hongkongensis TaxID=168471 RepID=A0A248LM23_9NEIS|nr:tRNA (adenosine(37)-N6)-threonylcarbamoyltransferase complex ATPase subunit type 1 TsaE [Laribacter hongkongensis]MBP8814582.1 tRNA (adenosine(37)-N6)-threonylcarbamoyltransferase complex ATPase subunit type 1 TsaE [Laribacter sp.]ASJ25406.1 tRNA threonylcarbamoyladenosine biosynthesis protein TsaE [Laribacter hongkongensis]MCG8992934.1 tRNA (adenosine(37)-N6)-threonylcarbamoyltransferase complex ATPase subunit type 1 TsaE [Laribacter hongkongensis]MCG8999148.1 tRNA (adenosine(37)-N6)-threon